MESATSNISHTVDKSNVFQRETITESILFDGRYAFGNDNGFKRMAIMEGILSDSRNAIRNSGILTTTNKGVSGCMNQRVTILATIIHYITFCYFNGG